MRRYRTCDNPRPANGGRACAGADTQIQRCSTASCPGELSQSIHSEEEKNVLLYNNSSFLPCCYSGWFLGSVAVVGSMLRLLRRWRENTCPTL